MNSATIADQDVRKVSNKGVVAARVIAAKIRIKAISMYRRRGKVDNIGKEIETLIPLLSDAMLVAHVDGIKRATKLRPSLLQAGVFDSALQSMERWLDERKARELERKYKTTAFSLVKEVATKVNEDLRNTIRDLIADGAHTKEAISVLKSRFDSLGIAPKSDFQLETLFRTQSAIAYSAGRWEADSEVQDILWGYKYITVGDDRVRPAHEAWDGVTLPKNDPFWKTHFPPNGWNCRCQVIPIFEKTRIVRPSQQLEPDTGFAFNPGMILQTSL